MPAEFGLYIEFYPITSEIWDNFSTALLQEKLEDIKVIIEANEKILSNKSSIGSENNLYSFEREWLTKGTGRGTQNHIALKHIGKDPKKKRYSLQYRGTAYLETAEENMLSLGEIIPLLYVANRMIGALEDNVISITYQSAYVKKELVRVDKIGLETIKNLKEHELLLTDTLDEFLGKQAKG